MFIGLSNHSNGTKVCDWTPCSSSGIQLRTITVSYYNCGNSIATEPRDCQAPVQTQTTCQQIQTSIGAWQTCLNGVQTKSDIYDNYNNVCGNTQIITTRTASIKSNPCV